ncbi:periplasmic heavy metal sensor [Parahaliea maris]|uniref:Periplasmic heavy metal sensor n=1 Tax=Parahaliea maris TaxID=2716870 RepID=A0A5C8ZNV2_9GAMM|nr:Spy/CpxP family protein refolding chaperone [Parahaliea maris]TXS90168.1 periplasmic heavy metal sensor [Parahaliea maris]
MKHLLKHTLSATGLSIALIGAGTALAGPGPGGPHDGGRMLAKMAEELELTEEQQGKIKAIYASSREQGAADRERLHELKQQMRASEGDFDEGSAQKAADEIGEITSRMTYQRASAQHQVREVLSDEQRAELDEMMEQRKERGERRWGKHRPDQEPTE